MSPCQLCLKYFLIGCVYSFLNYKRYSIFYLPPVKRRKNSGFSDDSFWRNIKHFNFTYLRKAFQTVLLNELELKTGPSFKKFKAFLIYKKDKNVFYIYAKSLTWLTLTPSLNASVVI